MDTVEPVWALGRAWAPGSDWEPLPSRLPRCCLSLGSCGLLAPGEGKPRKQHCLRGCSSGNGTSNQLPSSYNSHFPEVWFASLDLK